MKKSNIKLSLNKHKISTFKNAAVKGGVTGTTCKYTNKYYHTCFIGCQFQTFNCQTNDCYTNDCENTNYVCDH